MNTDLDYLIKGDVNYIEKLYLSFKQNKNSVEESWKNFFDGYDLAIRNHALSQNGTSKLSSEVFSKEMKVINLIDGYRNRGHLFAKTNPIKDREQFVPNLELEVFKLSQDDLDTVFNSGIEIGLGPAKLRDIISLLKLTYCKSIGIEYRYVRHPEKLKWFEKKMERQSSMNEYSVEKKRDIWDNLMQAVVFEKFLGTKFIGQKRFSLEGAESLIPALKFIIENGSLLGIKEFSIAMAHRGRLNVLGNVLQKDFSEIFYEFEGKKFDGEQMHGDVKYHKGYSSTIKLKTGQTTHLSLLANPSHLEAVNPVAIGITKAKIDFKHNNDYQKIAPIIIHGDAAIAGQGVVYEVLQMAKLDGYKVGGSIHLVINNQIGFTTNNQASRSSTYCTDIAKTTLSPVFHVNGDDVEALAYTINLAMEYRQKYSSDVFIDILSYRRYGHNESDEPRFTQPRMYKKIDQHPNPLEIYSKDLIEKGIFTEQEVQEKINLFNEKLQSKLSIARKENDMLSKQKPFAGMWKGFRNMNEGDNPFAMVETGIDESLAQELAKKIFTIPEDYLVNKKIKKIFDYRLEMCEKKLFDWTMAELLAMASLFHEKTPVRFTGQDSLRGTFSQRHVTITKQEEVDEYNIFSPLSKRLKFYNSSLSEYGVLGFEYGFSLVNPKCLNIWEAQFGDFANGAQIIIDQFIVSGEAKWQRSSGQVLLLPHGYEGQGPEHSSARIERFLELAAENNIQVANCTSPSNYFHLLRRQVKRVYRKPLIVFTPKSLLRHPKVVSPLNEFKDYFQNIIDDDTVVDNFDQVKRVLFCSGKIYYDLLAQKVNMKMAKKIAIVRIEQLYPLDYHTFLNILKKYKNAEYFWVQEEPENAGAWSYICRFACKHAIPLKVISRMEMACPAGGYLSVYQEQQKIIVQTSLNL